jgi:acyl-CoA synthetase (AMP-forming)/AMP-acid ligase II
LKTAVQRAIADYFGLNVHALAFLKVGGMPKTSSGKIRRQACRTAYLTGTLECVPVN